MQDNIVLLGIVFIPIAGAFIAPLLSRFSVHLRNWAALLCALLSFVLCLEIMPVILSGANITINKQLVLGFNFILTADGLALFMACVSSLVSTIIVWYSFGYISHYENQDEYYCMVLLFLGGMMGLVFSANLIFLYLFWEITAIASWRLIGFFREKIHVLKADKAFLVTVFGALLMLIGFIMLYQAAGSFDLAVIKEYFRTNPLPDIAVLLILAGIFSKSATLPFQTWLPDAGVAPSPVTALLHAAVLVKIGVYVYARIFVSTLTLNQFWHTAVPVVAAASALVSAGAALIETDLKRIIAYSTISQIGFIFFGLSTSNEIGVIGGLLFILMHGLSKGGLFLCAGIIEQNTGVRDITKLGGLIKTMPVTAVAFLFCAFSVMGIPPFGGFFSKYFVFNGAVHAGEIAISFVFLAIAILTILYLLRLSNMIFFGEPHTPPAREGSFVMVASVAILAALSLAGGILINYPFNFAFKAAQEMLGIVK